MIEFRTIEENGELVNWKFNTIEDILILYWSGKSEGLPNDSDWLEDDQYVYDGKVYQTRYFNNMVTELETIYWRKKAEEKKNPTSADIRKEDWKDRKLYQKINNEINEEWPRWKQEEYNRFFAYSTHADAV